MARPPAHLALSQPRRVGDHAEVTVRLSPSFGAALGNAVRAARRFAEAMAKVQETLGDTNGALAKLKEWARASQMDRSVYVAGLEARYYVRGGLDTRYATETAMDALVARILQGAELPGLTMAERVQVAGGFISGWVEHQGKARVPMQVRRVVVRSPERLRPAG